MIKGPKNAYPTNRGWVHEKTGELLKAQKITDAQIQEWIGVPAAPAPEVEAPETKGWGHPIFAKHLVFVRYFPLN